MLSSKRSQVIMQCTIADKPDWRRLEDLINASATPNSFLSLLSSGSLPQAIAVVEGLDRALVRDLLHVIGQGRTGGSHRTAVSRACHCDWTGCG